MIRYNQLKISAKISRDKHIETIRSRICKKLNIEDKDLIDFKVVKRSIDARKNDDINYIYCIDFNCSKKIHISKNDKNISFVEDKQYHFPQKINNLLNRPVIVGLGPAGLFCGLMLSKNGYNPIILERGKRVEERTADVEAFWKNGVLNPDSNVQFGEGGAGTFSDGKLNTLVKDKYGRNKEVLRLLVEFGAPEEILYDNKPHIGTDLLKNVVKNISSFIVNNGGEIHYNSCVDRFVIENNKIKAVGVGDELYYSDNVVLALGHSARDTFELLKRTPVNMEKKAFAIGFRVMHPQKIIDINQYGDGYESYDLPVASYKMTSNFDRGVYSFCMCPGGYVVNASSEKNRLAVNGMSYHDRDSGVANSAIIIQVTPDDYESDDVLAGMYWQRKLEEKAFELCNGKIPLQKYGDFKSAVTGIVSPAGELVFEPACKGEYAYEDLSNILNFSLNHCFINGMEHFGKIIDKFNDSNAIMAGIESRTSSPVRIVRDNKGMGSVEGIYPCGEGAGYAGGITSAAMDGIYIAECIVLNN